MKILVYNRFWTTYGGGERYAGKLAEVLSRRHEVHIILVGDASWPSLVQSLRDRLDVDLRGCFAIRLPDDERWISVFSRFYDAFFNCTHFSKAKGFSKYNAVLLNFPLPPRMAHRNALSLAEFMHRLRKLLFVNSPDVVVEIELSDSTDLLCRVIFNSLGLARRYVIIELAHGVAENARNVKILASNEEVNHQMIGDYLIAPTGPECVSMLLVLKKPRPCYWSNPITRVGTLNEEDKVRFLRIRVVVPQFQGLDREQSPYLGWDLILTNSNFTRRCLRDMWGVDSRILFPPARMFPQLEKQRVILSVGRFFRHGHSKRQDVLIRVFKRMCDAGVIEGWRLVLVGGTHRERQHMEYLHTLVSSASGYPIEFGFNISQGRLAKLFGLASVYWHAAGYGEDELRRPENFEHFGIVIVEAMSAGVIPIVFKGGGAKELVSEGVNGYVWSTESELERQTMLAIQEADRLRIAAKAAAKVFGDYVYEREVLSLLGEIERRLDTP